MAEALVGSNEGYITKVYADGTASVVYSSARSGGHDSDNYVALLSNKPDDNSWIMAGENVLFPGAAETADVATTSDDSGGTWAATSNTLRPPFEFTIRPGVYGMEEDGTIWGVIDVADSPILSQNGHRDFYSSIDRGATWVLRHSVGHNVVSPNWKEGWISNGYLWQAVSAPGASPPAGPNLLRLDLVLGTASISLFVLPGFTGLHLFSGWYDCDRLYCYRPGPIIGSSSHDLIVVDISTNPATSTTLFSVFGTDHHPEAVLPLPNGTAVAHVIADDLLTGQIWHSADNGATWTKVVDSIAGLAITSNERSFIKAAYDNPLELWMTGRFPYVYHSLDGGLTWAEIAVTAAYGTASVWNSLCIVGTSTPPVPETCPGLALYPAEIGQAAIWGPALL